jgi:hypothetical protein
MIAKLLHWWRLLIEPSGEGKLFGVGMPSRWRVRYKDGVSRPMAYNTACNYARMFDGKVERSDGKAKS